jgi:hypothetical protein
MADALITRIGSVHRMFIRPVGAVRKYADAEDPLAAGRQLAVDDVLEGSIQRADKVELHTSRVFSATTVANTPKINRNVLDRRMAARIQGAE